MRQHIHKLIKVSYARGYMELFVAMKCSPNWPEIRRTLLTVQLPQNRRDLADGISMMKRQAGISYKIAGKVFGSVTLYVRIVEF